ncbi:MAG TPA: DNRLRE domain-containing protein [Anaerolineales bacterium]|nr:DNRLRE domain-containing protein [Anaerolineales bacterium]
MHSPISGVSWSNQPSTTGAPATAGSGNADREWNVTSVVQGMYADANNGFLIRDPSENRGGFEQQFHSREKGESMP